MEEGRKHCIKDAVEKFKLWRGSCGRSGWYDMDDASLFIFFESIYPPIEPKPLPPGLPDDEAIEMESELEVDRFYGIGNRGDFTDSSHFFQEGAKWMRSLAEKLIQNAHSKGYGEGYQEGLYDQHNK